MPDHRLPPPASDDPEDVVLALHTAAALWAKGEQHDAVHWVRRAATSAGENGHDMRAVALAGAAADLTTALSVPPSVRASVPVSPATQPGAVQAGLLTGTGSAFRPNEPTWGLMDADDVDKTLVDQLAAVRAEPGPDLAPTCHAYRVAVQKSSADPRSFSVRLLTDTEVVEDGSAEAVLVALDWELDLSAHGRER